MKKKKTLNFQTRSALQTKKLASLLVKEILSKRINRKKALIFALRGELGTGKTTFIQGFLRGLGIKKRVTSPTFVIIKNYELRIENDGKYRRAYHVDCYRIKKSNELLKLGLKNILTNPQNIALIEWAEKIRRILPKNPVWIKFSHGNEVNERTIKLIRN